MSLVLQVIFLGRTTKQHVIITVLESWLQSIRIRRHSLGILTE